MHELVSHLYVDCIRMDTKDELLSSTHRELASFPRKLVASSCVCMSACQQIMQSATQIM